MGAVDLVVDMRAPQPLPTRDQSGRLRSDRPPVAGALIACSTSVPAAISNETQPLLRPTSLFHGENNQPRAN
jgi:hypothetical protein